MFDQFRNSLASRNEGSCLFHTSLKNIKYLDMLMIDFPTSRMWISVHSIYLCSRLQIPVLSVGTFSSEETYDQIGDRHLSKWGNYR